MELHLLDGQFDTTDAITMITELIQVKIKYHENKIMGSQNEEDIKMRERKIKTLQKELAHSREYILSQKSKITINSAINLSYHGK
jgi:hypothetical protein